MTLPDLFQKALRHAGTHTAQDIIEGIQNGSFIYLGDDRACAVLEVVHYPLCRKLNVFLAAGDLDRLLDVFLPQMIDIARENGCVSVMNTARKGFLRHLPARGFKSKNISFELELKG
jgi:hypothetical protein